jgi:hypothetical protein
VEHTSHAGADGGPSGVLTGSPAADPLAAALRYAEQRHWDVVPGTWLTATEGDDEARRCSCGDPACAAPGAHPERSDWAGCAVGSAVRVRRLWAERPLASVLLPTGRAFDALDVPEAAGCLALARLDRTAVALGPVLCLPTRRLVFLVQPGATAKVPALLRRLGWLPDALDLVVHGEGGWLPAPPTRIGSAGRARWARRPDALNRRLPDAESILSPLAYACAHA